MKISHVIRGEEWLPSAPLHVMLYRYLGWEESMPKFAHLPLLLKPDGNGKLSKRDGDRLGFPVFALNWTDPVTGEVSSGYRERGYLPEAVLNMLALLGWNPGDNRELLSKEEVVELFSLEHVHKAGAKFDFEKAKWFNAEYIKKLSDKELAVMVQDDIEKNYRKKDLAFLEKACRLIKERLIFTTDVASQYRYLFERPQTYGEAVISKIKSIKEVLAVDALTKFVETLSLTDSAEIENKLKEFASQNSVKPGDLMKFLRASLVGEFSGPAVPDLIILLGTLETATRINNCFSQL
jgi:glutamyl-tRNA synthetase